MTQLEVAYRYVAPPTEAMMRAIDNCAKSMASGESPSTRQSALFAWSLTPRALKNL